MRRAISPALLGLLPLCGCANRSRPAQAALHRFPIGIYGVDRPSALKTLNQSGFDSIQSYSRDPAVLSALAAEGRRLGMGLVVTPYPLFSLPPAQARRWPVDAWYLTDEPDVYKTPPGELESSSARVRRWDPGHPQTFVIGEGGPSALYGGLADILMLDWYPVPHLPLDSVADQIDEAYSHLPAGKPLWMVVQAFDWRDSEQRDTTKPRVGRFPDHAELRFMSYLSIVHGAKGLFYFTFNKPGGRTLLDVPEEWQALERVAREMKAMQPILERGRPEPIPVSLKADGLEGKAWRWRGRNYVVLLNRRKKTMAPVPPEFLSFTWRPLFESRRYARELLKEAGGVYYLEPYRVLVLESAFHWRG